LGTFAQFVAYVPYDPITDTGGDTHGMALHTAPLVFHLPLLHIAFCDGVYPVLHRNVQFCPFGVDRQLSNSPFVGFGVGADAQLVGVGCVHEPGLHAP
jgi:hypothetical protein